MNDYMDLIKKIIDKYNHYSAKTAKYKVMENENPFEAPLWLKKNIESSVTAREALHNLLETSVDAITRNGYCLERWEAEDAIDVQYGFMGVYRTRYAYNTFYIRRCDNAESDD